MKTPRSLVLSVALCALYPFAPIKAQTAPTSPAKAAVSDEVIELSPFITNSASEQGYVATSSLAGSRVNIRS